METFAVISTLLVFAFLVVASAMLAVRQNEEKRRADAAFERFDSQLAKSRKELESLNETVQEVEAALGKSSSDRESDTRGNPDPPSARSGQMRRLGAVKRMRAVRIDDSRVKKHDRLVARRTTSARTLISSKSKQPHNRRRAKS